MLGPLTQRETEVLKWVRQGKSNKEIAVVLGIEPKTVAKHLERIFKKLGVENRTAAALYKGTNRIATKLD
jgi:DNA-binding CsgD family transcriptional regulator